MKMLPKLFLIFAVLVSAYDVWCSVDYDDFRNDIFVLSWQALDSQDIAMICQKQVTPHQAAQLLREAGFFSSHSESFAPYLHELYYHLGQYTHRRDAVWTPEVMNVCVRLMRYMALFRSLQRFKTPPHIEAVITVLPTIPANPCEPLNGFYQLEPWTAVPGSTVQKVLALLPRRALNDVRIGFTSWIDASGNKTTVKNKLQRINYQLKNGVWAWRLQDHIPNKLTSGTEFMLLAIEIPPQMQPGIYSCSMTITRDGGKIAGKHIFTLTIQPSTGQK